jgi:hypothetical protein
LHRHQHHCNRTSTMTPFIVFLLAALAAAVPQGKGGKSSGAKPNIDPNLDYPTKMCMNHPPGKAPSQTEIMFGSPNGSGPDEQCIKDNSGGSGLYKAKMTTDSTLPDHTVYAPATPPAEKMPLIVWNNGLCLREGSEFEQQPPKI